LSVAQVSRALEAVTTTDFASASSPFPRWFRKEGIAIAARIPMIRMTTSSSISEKPLSLRYFVGAEVTIGAVEVRNSRSLQEYRHFMRRTEQTARNGPAA
jgi:hypothetical protein